MKKTLFILLFTISASAQLPIRYTAFDTQDYIAAQNFKIQDVPKLLLDKTFYYKVFMGKMPYKFISMAEFEEVRGGEVLISGGKIYFPVTVICNNYNNKREKFLFNFTFVYIDSANGLVFEKIESGLGQKM